ncbi:hypothetical protein GCM10011329_30850 [Stakelama pacifica]|nr:hypothetical protein GCM10011329_30850 [Stakelama pacifica]
MRRVFISVLTNIAYIQLQEKIYCGAQMAALAKMTLTMDCTRTLNNSGFEAPPTPPARWVPAFAGMAAKTKLR